MIYILIMAISIFGGTGLVLFNLSFPAIERSIYTEYPLARVGMSILVFVICSITFFIGLNGFKRGKVR